MSAVDISVLGDKQLERKLARLLAKTQKKIVRQAIRKEAKEAKKRVVGNIEKQDLVKTRVMLNAYRSAKIRTASNKPRSVIRIGVENPKRDDLGISADDKYYYPYAVEFGHSGAKAYPFIRPAIDEHQAKSKRRVAAEIAAGIHRESRR